MGKVFAAVSKFTNKYPGTIAWRLKRHCAVIEDHLNPGEELLYAFCGQHNAKPSEFFETCVVAITNERLLIAQKRVLFGYYLTSITPDLYNDLEVVSNLIWGTVVIDTVKETVYISNLPKRALREIETQVTSYMLEAKKKIKGSL